MIFISFLLFFQLSVSTYFSYNFEELFCLWIFVILVDLKIYIFLAPERDSYPVGPNPYPWFKWGREFVITLPWLEKEYIQRTAIFWYKLAKFWHSRMMFSRSAVAI